MTWHQLSITTDENTAPLIADFFSKLGAVSVTYMDAKDQPVYEPAIGETKIWQQTIVIGLYELDIEPDFIKKVLFSQFENLSLENWQQLLLEDQVWERTWMEHYQPMKFANKLWVCPTGQEKNEADCVCLVLDPGLAFGTGTHPTTALCLEWLAKHDLTDKTVIDYGCGSGILAIAAVLLGAQCAYAIDIDPQALVATQANAIKNKVTDKVHRYLVEAFTPISVDIVMANILAKPLMNLHKPIGSLVKNEGTLVLSGILNEQAEQVRDVYVPEFDFNPTVSLQDWCRLDAMKRSD
jgi:ribosomal protein L11 methyltransferase